MFIFATFPSCILIALSKWHYQLLPVVNKSDRGQNQIEHRGGHLFNYGVRENIISPVLEDPIQKDCSFSMHSVFCFVFSFLAESLDLWEQSNRQRYELLEKTSHCKLYVVAMNNEETMNSRSGVFLCLIQVLDRLKMNKNKNRTWYDVWYFILFERNNSTGDNYCFLMCHNWNFGTEL